MNNTVRKMFKELCLNIVPGFKVKVKSNNVILINKSTKIIQSLPEFLYYEIPKLISINKWNSYSLTPRIQEEMINGMKPNSIITENMIYKWIDYLHSLSKETETIKINNLFENNNNLYKFNTNFKLGRVVEKSKFYKKFAINLIPYIVWVNGLIPTHKQGYRLIHLIENIQSPKIPFYAL